jgi:hypothetical protein
MMNSRDTKDPVAAPAVAHHQAMNSSHLSNCNVPTGSSFYRSLQKTPWEVAVRDIWYDIWL